MPHCLLPFWLPPIPTTATAATAQQLLLKLLHVILSWEILLTAAIIRGSKVPRDTLPHHRAVVQRARILADLGAGGGLADAPSLPASSSFRIILRSNYK